MNIKMLACAAFGMMLTANVFAQEEDVTHYIVNAGFDEDISFNADGTAAKAIVSTGNKGSRSEWYKAEDGSIYAKSIDGATNVAGDPSWHGYATRIKGWTITNESETPEWFYFGSIPYDVQQGMLALGGGNPAGAVESPGKPEAYNTEDNKGFLHLRAGWGNACTYKQVVSLPCAEYRLEYWSINSNSNTSASNTTNLSKVTCRSDEFVDETGLTDAVWTKHEIIFTPTTEFTIEFGFQSDGSKGSGDNPWISIDGIKLYKIGEADQEDLMTSDLMDATDELYNLMGDDRLADFTGIQSEMSDIAMEAEDASTVEEMEAAIAMLKAYTAKINELFSVIEEYNALYAEGEKITNAGTYPGLADFTTTFNNVTDKIADAGVDEFVALVAELKAATNAYYFSQEASVDSPADYTFLIPNPHFVKPGYEPTYENGVATYPVEEQPTGRPEWESSEGWYKGTVTDGDQRLGYNQGRVCWNLWDNHAGYHAISTDLTGLPNGYYTVSADMITQAEWAGEYAHVYAQSSAAKVVSANLTEGNWIQDGEGTWTTLTTEKVLVADGKLTIGGESEFPNGNQMGWFNMSNVKLYYLGGFSEDDYKEIYNTTIAEAQAMCDGMVFQADKAAFQTVISENNSASTIEEMTAALANINAAKATAQASIDRWEGVSTGSWQNLQDSISAGVYSAEATQIAQKIVDIMTAAIYASDATYTTMDAKTAVLRKYRDSYLPTFMKVQAAVYTTDAAKNVIANNINAQVAELTAITDFPTEAEMDAYVAELNATIAEADRLESINSQKPGDNVDFTALIANADVNADNNGTGWTISKGTGNTNTGGGQQFDGDANGRYLDSWNGTAGSLNYTAYQTLNNIPNGTYEIKAMTRTTGDGSYLYAIADNSADGVFAPFKKNADFNYTQEYDPHAVSTVTGGDSIVVTPADRFGSIWQTSRDYCKNTLELQVTVDELGVGLKDAITEYLAEVEEGVKTASAEDLYHTAVAGANDALGRGWTYTSVQVEVKNHVLTIGVTTDAAVSEGKTDVDGNACVPFTGTWFSADNFTLTMLKAGDNTDWDPTQTGIEGVTGTENAVPVAIYNINGVRVAAPAKGINIIKMSDGTVQKVLVK